MREPMNMKMGNVHTNVVVKYGKNMFSRTYPMLE